MSYYKIVSTSNRHTDWTESVRLSQTKTIGSSDATACELNDDDRATLKRLGLGIAEVAADDHKKAVEAPEYIQEPGQDVIGSSPDLTTVSAANQPEALPAVEGDEEGEGGANEPKKSKSK